MTDNLIAICLEGISRHARNLRYSAQEMSHYVGMMQAQRPFLTEAEGKMDEAEAALVEALEKVRAEREAFRALPKEMK